MPDTAKVAGLSSIFQREVALVRGGKGVGGRKLSFFENKATMRGCSFFFVFVVLHTDEKIRVSIDYE